MEQVWSLEDARKERAVEIQRRRELLAVRKANALKAMERAAERQMAMAAARAASQAASQAAAVMSGEPAPADGQVATGMIPNLETVAHDVAPSSPIDGGDRRKRCLAPLCCLCMEDLIYILDGQILLPCMPLPLQTAEFRDHKMLEQTLPTCLGSRLESRKTFVSIQQESPFSLLFGPQR